MTIAATALAAALSLLAAATSGALQTTRDDFGRVPEAAVRRARRYANHAALTAAALLAVLIVQASR